MFGFASELSNTKIQSIGRDFKDFMERWGFEL